MLNLHKTNRFNNRFWDKDKLLNHKEDSSSSSDSESDNSGITEIDMNFEKPKINETNELRSPVWRRGRASPYINGTLSSIISK